MSADLDAMHAKENEIARLTTELLISRRECEQLRAVISANTEKCQSTENSKVVVDWKEEALRRFGPIPPGGGANESSRLIAGYHYAFVEGAMAALSLSSQKYSGGPENG